MKTATFFIAASLIFSLSTVSGSNKSHIISLNDLRSVSFAAPLPPAEATFDFEKVNDENVDFEMTGQFTFFDNLNQLAPATPTEATFDENAYIDNLSQLENLAPLTPEQATFGDGAPFDDLNLKSLEPATPAEADF